MRNHVLKSLSRRDYFSALLKDGDLVGQAIEQRAGQVFLSEGFGPFVEGQDAGDQCGAAFIAL
jgi:hypothetical protein